MERWLRENKKDYLIFKGGQGGVNKSQNKPRRPVGRPRKAQPTPEPTPTPRKRGRQSSITDIEKQLIIKLYKNGMQLHLISKYLEHSKTTIIKIIDESGTPRRNERTKQ